MDTIGTYQISLDTPINLLTPRQLFEMQAQWLQTQPQTAPKESKKSRKWYVNSIIELAKILGTSTTTIYRMKKNGLLDDAISQYGRWMFIDVEKVIETFKLSNRGKRRKKG